MSWMLSISLSIDTKVDAQIVDVVNLWAQSVISFFNLLWAAKLQSCLAFTHPFFHDFYTIINDWGQ